MMKLDSVLEIILDMNTTCIKCEGTRAISVGDSYCSSYKQCDRCKGTGIEPKEG